MTDDMDEEWCTKHSCQAVPLTNEEGSAIIGIDCPRCMDERERQRADAILAAKILKP